MIYFILSGCCLLAIAFLAWKQHRTGQKPAQAPPVKKPHEDLTVAEKPGGGHVIFETTGTVESDTQISRYVQPPDDKEAAPEPYDPHKQKLYEPRVVPEPEYHEQDYQKEKPIEFVFDLKQAVIGKEILERKKFND